MGIVGQDNMVIGFMVSRRVRNAIDKGAEVVQTSSPLPFCGVWIIAGRSRMH
jgi:hypothetical protein